MNPRAPHQRYCTRECGDLVRRDWEKQERKDYMKEYWQGYVRPSLRQPHDP